MKTLVYKFGCRAPDNEHLALQVLGQAYHYREDIRRVLNDYNESSSALSKDDDCAHVRLYVQKQKRAGKQRVREAGRRGHLIDAGTYWLLEDEVEQAAEKRWPERVKQQVWDGAGRIGVAIQSVDAFRADAWETRRRSAKRVSLTAPDDKGHAALSITIGELKCPFTITWPIKLHRSFPENAVVKRVHVQRVRVGWRYRWEACFTLGIPNDEQVRDQAATGTVGVDIGYRVDSDDLLRVATCSDGTRLDCDVLDDLFYSDEVQGTRDRLFDDVKLYIKNQKLPGHEHVHAWRNKARVYDLAKRTQDFGLLWWAYRDRHLEDIEANVRDRALRRRKDRYRVFADTLAKKYRTLALEDLHVSDLPWRDTHAQERRKAHAALGLLVEILEHRFGPGRVQYVSPDYTSQDCSACGLERVIEKTDAETVTCSACGAVHQRDENAAKIIERRSCKGEGRSARSPKRKEKKSKKRPKGPSIGTSFAAARNSLDNAAE